MAPKRNGYHTLTTLLLAVLVLYSSKQQCSAADFQMQGFQYMQEKNYAKALECFNAIRADQPNHWQVLQNIGNCQMHLGQYDKAIIEIQRSIDAGGLHSSQCTIMAAALEGLGQPKKALNWLKLACSVDPAQAVNPGMQAAIKRLQDPAVNPTGSPDAPDYLVGLTSVNRWRNQDMPIKVFVRNNYQLPSFSSEFKDIVRNSLDQWCNATSGAISYKFVNSKDAANIICDYTDHRELVSSNHEPGIDGNSDTRIRMQDKTMDWANIVVLVKDTPTSSAFRDRAIVTKTLLHEFGHALGMHGHSSNTHDVMFLAATPEPISKLSQRDIATIKRIYQH
jgi:tetratricopeptide (TPR) repeat protein